MVCFFLLFLFFMKIFVLMMMSVVCVSVTVELNELKLR